MNRPSDADLAELLSTGELNVLGRIRSASNATFLCESTLGERTVHCVYKPVAGEAPLWDFPDGTLAGRERAAYQISAALGWDIVPHTVIRGGPAGIGMVQVWVDQPGDGLTDEPSEGDGDDGLDLVDLVPAGEVPAGYLPILQAYDQSGDAVLLVHADDDRLRRMAVFDVLINNADRKGGHILAGVDGRVRGVDHGVTLHTEDKLRTVLWGWAGKPVSDDALRAIDQLRVRLHDGLGDQLREHLTPAEVTALDARITALLDDPVMPSPDRHRPIPWPAF